MARRVCLASVKQSKSSTETDEKLVCPSGTGKKERQLPTATQDHFSWEKGMGKTKCQNQHFY